jgi:hypothetical protein
MNIMTAAGPKGLQGTRQPSRKLNDLRLGTNETANQQFGHKKWHDKSSLDSDIPCSTATMPRRIRGHTLCAATPIVSSSSYCNPDLSVATARPESPSSQALGKSQYAASITRDCYNVTSKGTTS